MTLDFRDAYRVATPGGVVLLHWLPHVTMLPEGPWLAVMHRWAVHDLTHTPGAKGGISTYMYRKGTTQGGKDATRLSAI